MKEKVSLGPLNINGLELESPVMVGAGAVKTVEDVKRAADSRSAAIVVGSITVEPRGGNGGNTYYYHPTGRFSLNSMGLPNPGMAYYQSHLPEMAKIAHDHGKKLIVSTAGFSPVEFVRLSQMVAKSGADGQELNTGCPNAWGEDGRQKSIASFNPELLGDILDLQEMELGFDFWTSLKLSPFSDPGRLVEVARILNNYQIIRALVSINAFPNAYYFNQEGDQAISFGSGLAGMAGDAIRPIGLGNIRQLREVVNKNKALIASGGISQNSHLGEYFLAGAVAAQVTTAYINEGPQVFDRLLLG